MRLKFGLGLLAPAAMLGAQPVSAQASAEVAEVTQMLQGLWQAEPLTADQEARLPLAGQLVEKVVPEGAYARMMADVLDQMLEPIKQMMPSAMPAPQIAALTGQDVEIIAALPKRDQAELGAMLDPAYERRSGLMMDIMMGEMGGMMSAMEPALRAGLTRAYAVRFTQPQMEDIAAFFATQTGAFYASESMLVFADPQVMAASMEAVPMIMEAMPEIIAKMQQAEEQLSPPRFHDDLTELERARMAELLGLTLEELASGMTSLED